MGIEKMRKHGPPDRNSESKPPFNENRSWAIMKMWVLRMAERRKKKKSASANKSAVKLNKVRRKRVAGSSFADLAASQKIKPTKNAVELGGGFPIDENIDQFLDEIYKART
jgi:hypothetical protein